MSRKERGGITQEATELSPSTAQRCTQRERRLSRKYEGLCGGCRGCGVSR